MAAVVVGVIGVGTLGLLVGFVVGVLTLALGYALQAYSFRPLREGDHVRYMHGLQDVTGVLGEITRLPGRRSGKVTLDGTGGVVSVPIPLESMRRVRGGRALRKLPWFSRRFS